MSRAKMSYAVRLCPKCPYSPSDLGPHYDSYAPWPCCVVCEPKSTTVCFPRMRVEPPHRIPQLGFPSDAAGAGLMP
jgi:hypothetical protein